MAKEIIFNTDARTKIKDGIDILADAVKVTLGPRGRNVIIEKPSGVPHITKDGVSVAKEVELSDPFNNVGAQLVKSVASKTCDDAGDGTTTATVLAQAIVSAGLKNITAGANPMDLKRGIDAAVKAVIDSLNSQKRVVEDSAIIEQVATISANNDAQIGTLIANAVNKVSTDGVITIEESRGTETYIKIVDGMQIDRGYLSPYFVTDTERMECVMENPYIFITDRKVSQFNEILPVLEQVVRSNRPLLILADDVDSEALTSLVVNRLRGGLKICAIKAPGFGNRRKEMLEDIAILTGGQVISDEKGMNVSNVTLDQLGEAEKIIVTKDNTIVISDDSTKDSVDARIKQIKNLINSVESEYDREKMRERIAKLSGGVAVLYIGASTEIEMKEKKDRADDALCATRAALEEGIIPGGGTAFIRAIESLADVKSKNADFNTGVDIVRNALQAPLRQIAFNSGVEGAVIVNKVMEGSGDFGYNAREDEFVSMFESGIIDPVKVARVALENAASIGGMFLTTECMIVESKTDQPSVPNVMPQMNM